MKEEDIVTDPVTEAEVSDNNIPFMDCAITGEVLKEGDQVVLVRREPTEEGQIAYDVPVLVSALSEEERANLLPDQIKTFPSLNQHLD